MRNADSKPEDRAILRKLRQFELAERVGDIGHWVWNIGSPVVEWSPQTYRIHRMEPRAGGVALKQAIGFYREADREMVQEALRDAIAAKSGFSFEAVLDLAGAERFVRSDGECELSADGDVVSIFGIIQNISDRREAERQMRRMQERQTDLIEISTDWVWEMGPDLRFTYMSPQVQQVTGVPAGFHIGKSRRELMEGKEISLEMEMHLAWLEQHKPFRDFRYWREGPDGLRQYISTSGKPFLDENGNFAGYRGVGRDLTAFQKAKEELIEANRKLNVANKAKSDALASLKEANAMLEIRNADMQRVQGEIEHRALHDALTGIANRRFLDVRLEELAEHCRATGAWLGVMHIDLDRFKHINDTLGHAAGDAVLRHVARVLAASVASDDFVARVGGDEFVVVSSGHGGAEALGRIASRLIEELSRPVRFEGRDCWFGASVGIATLRGAEICANQLLVNADVALYRAKREGRGQYVFYSAQLQQEIIDYKAVADGILAGLKNGEFEPWFQPQVCARTFRLLGVEALARWNCPQKGIRLPAEFLPVAEDLGVVAAIDGMILERTIEAFNCWRRDGLDAPRVSVNVSARRLMDERLVEGIRELNFAPGALCFELLESVFLDDLDDRISWNIDMLKEMGIDVALDDFGSGHASLISLVQLGPDAIKIDRQLIAAMRQSQTRVNLVRSIVDISKSLNVRVVAEGVETRQEAELLAGMSCDVLQGFFIAPPMSRDRMTSFIRNWNPAGFLDKRGLKPESDAA